MLRRLAFIADIRDYEFLPNFSLLVNDYLLELVHCDRLPLLELLPSGAVVAHQQTVGDVVLGNGHVGVNGAGVSLDRVCLGIAI
jgi:hypothetical protein